MEKRVGCKERGVFGASLTYGMVINCLAYSLLNGYWQHLNTCLLAERPSRPPIQIARGSLRSSPEDRSARCEAYIEQVYPVLVPPRRTCRPGRERRGETPGKKCLAVDTHGTYLRRELEIRVNPDLSDAEGVRWQWFNRWIYHIIP